MAPPAEYRRWHMCLVEKAGHRGQFAEGDSWNFCNGEAETEAAPTRPPKIRRITVDEGSGDVPYADWNLTVPALCVERTHPARRTRAIAPSARQLRLGKPLTIRGTT